MTLKLFTLAASAVLGVCNAAYAADVMEVAQPTIFTPYVALGDHCEGELADQRLSGVPVPAPAKKSLCADLEKKSVSLPAQKTSSPPCSSLTARAAGSSASIPTRPWTVPRIPAVPIAPRRRVS